MFRARKKQSAPSIAENPQEKPAAGAARVDANATDRRAAVAIRAKLCHTESTHIACERSSIHDRRRATSSQRHPQGAFLQGADIGEKQQEARQAAARFGAARMPRRVAGARKARRRDRHLGKAGRNARARACPHPSRAHGRLCVRILPRNRRHHGARPGADSLVGHPRAGMRRCARGELRAVPLPRTSSRLRHQRLRRNLPRAVGMGRQAIGRKP